MSAPGRRLGLLAADTALASPPEGAGVIAAGVVALAAGLCESLARASELERLEVRGAAVQALALRERADALAAANAAAYAAARGALGGEALPPGTGRDAALREALITAADTVVAVAAAAADCAEIAAEIAHVGDVALRADAAGAAEMAAAAARAARGLTDVNLALLAGDERRRQAAGSVAAAERACARARREAALD